MNALNPRAQIRLSPKRPVGANDAPRDIAKKGVEPPDNLLGVATARLGAYSEAIGD
jgi:hypothetical protein